MGWAVANKCQSMGVAMAAETATLRLRLALKEEPVTKPGVIDTVTMVGMCGVTGKTPTKFGLGAMVDQTVKGSEQCW